MYFKHTNWLCKWAKALEFFNLYCHHSEKERHLLRFLIWKKVEIEVVFKLLV